MTIRWENLTVGSRAMRAYVGIPDSHAPHPGVVVAMHGLGIDASMLDVVHRLHRAGYAAAMPDLYHRQAADVPDPISRIKLLKDEEIVTDMNAAADLLSASGRVGRLGVTGFCMGGRIAYLMACADPRYRAAAVFYGGGIMDSWGGGPAPFKRSGDIGCPLLGIFGASDSNPSPADVAAIDAELNRLGKWHEFHMYRDTGHGFQNFLSSERFRTRAAQASWGELLAFFDHFLRCAVIE